MAKIIIFCAVPKSNRQKKLLKLNLSCDIKEHSLSSSLIFISDQPMYLFSKPTYLFLLSKRLLFLRLPAHRVPISTVTMTVENRLMNNSISNPTKANCQWYGTHLPTRRQEDEYFNWKWKFETFAKIFVPIDYEFPKKSKVPCSRIVVDVVVLFRGHKIDVQRGVWLTMLRLHDWKLCNCTAMMEIFAENAWTQKLP